MVVGVLILNSVGGIISLAPGSTFYMMYASVRRSITVGYTLVAELTITFAAAAVTKYLDLW